MNGLDFYFQIEDDFTESDIETLWKDTQKLNAQWEKFNKGLCNEDEFNDMLRMLDLDPDDMAIAQFNNLRLMGVV